MILDFKKEIQAGNQLSQAEAYLLMQELLDPVTETRLVSETLLSLNSRLPSVDELTGYVEFIAANANSCELDCNSHFDLCGTGGDGKNSINISTLSAFVLAAMGEKVAKHGNYAASSKFGSSNLLEAFGVKLHSDTSIIRENFKKHLLVFLHAPFMHPALKVMAPIRKALGVRTVFNLMGPLLNPAKPRFQIVGTVKAELAELLANVLQRLSVSREMSFATLADHAGYDEVSLTANCCLFTGPTKSQLEYKLIQPETFGLRSIPEQSIAGVEDIQALVKISKDILKGLGTQEQSQVIAANVALALSLKYPDRSLRDLSIEALATIRSGSAYNVMEKLSSKS